MKKNFDTPEEFYKNAMDNIVQIVGNKLKVLGVEPSEIPFLLDAQELNRYTSDNVDGIILEMYEYKGIRLAEFEWTGNGVKQRDINPDERDFKRDL